MSKVMDFQPVFPVLDADQNVPQEDLDRRCCYGYIVPHCQEEIVCTQQKTLLQIK